MTNKFDLFEDLKLNENSLRSLKGGAWQDTGSCEGRDSDTVDDCGCTYFYSSQHEECDTNQCDDDPGC
jgi:hypothetical protein